MTPFTSGSARLEPEHLSLLNMLPCMAWLLDSQGHIQAVNPAFVDAFPESVPGLLNQPLAALLTTDRLDSAPSGWTPGSYNGTPLQLQLLLPVDNESASIVLEAQVTCLPGTTDVWLATLIPDARRGQLKLQQDSHALETLNRIQHTISAELDLEKVVQAVTDAGVELTGAQFGAFFYTINSHQGEPLTLYTLSGAPREAFAHYPLPRMTQVFGPTFRNERVVRSDDITQDARYARNAPYHGMPAGHLPVRSYLAVPVVASNSQVIGGFFFGHERAGVFGEQAEQLAVSLAAQAAVAFQNAQLYRSARLSERRFRSLVEATSQMVWTCAPTGEFQTPQADWQRFTGQTEQEALGWGWLDAVHPHDRAHVRQSWSRAAELQRPYQVECRVRRSDSAYRFMQARATPVQSESGSVNEWIGVHEDITERRDAEQQLRDREVLYQTLVEHAVVGVSRLTPDGRCLDINPAGTAFLGYSRESLIGGHINAVTHPGDRQATAHALQRLLKGEVEAVTVEKRYLRPDGSMVWSNSSISAVRQENGAVAYLVVTMADITALKQAEAELLRLNAELELRIQQRTTELEQERGFLRTLLESLTEGIVACDAQGRLTVFNDVTRTFHGLPPESLPPGEWAAHYSLYREDGVTPLPTEEIPLLRAFQGEQVRDQAMVIAPVQGERRWVNASGNPMYNLSGEKVGAVVAMQDVTERRVAEHEIRRVNAELQRSNADLEHFAAVASHDLKAPLRTITSFLQLLERRYAEQLDEKGHKYIAFTVEAAARMDALIDDLLAYARVGRQRTIMTLNPEHVMQEVADNLSASFQEKSARLIVGPLPAVQADSTQLRQVFQNLVGNAIKFQPPGRTPEVDVSARADGGWVHFQVTDNGIGIAPEYFEKVFGLFQQVHGNTEYAGSGLGLAIVRKIVEEHGGRTWVTSVEGEGTTFHFTLPGCDVPL
ncbi:PAS domain S-box protein [Deinococcus sp. Arct2-2]|uniref:PAS domain S-box protein n=1 Tax=Deinococcus sp. Arct2-2 TaxID=2568653 RepID=UPI0010A50639|nr:PAS domain S-box protein [Deinococcus sp. Arct2-2]THF67938.1 PAS domain S-box protein [Deinococcus sp. Arct2-2]